MEFINNTVSWIKGELFEAAWILSFGIATIIAGILFWKAGTTSGSKALLLPFVIVGFIYAGVGTNMLASNKRRMKEYPVFYQKNQLEFLKSEKQRVEEFQYQYKISKVVATVCFVFTLMVFWFTANPALQGAGIGASLFGLSGLVVDYFSEERAKIYYTAILETLKQIN